MKYLLLFLSLSSTSLLASTEVRDILNFLEAGPELKANLDCADVPFETQNLACTDMEKFACNGGVKDDGATIKGNREVFEQKLQEAKKREAPKLQAEYLKLLETNPQAQDFIAKQLPNIAYGELCKDPKKPFSKKCLQEMASKLSFLSLDFVDSKPIPFSMSNSMAVQYSAREGFLKNPLVAPVFDGLNTSLEKAVGRKEQEKVLAEDMFPKIKGLIMAKIEKDARPEMKEKLLNRIQNIKMNGLTCYGQSYLKSAHKVGGGSYNGQTHSFGLCLGNIFQGQSEFQIAQIMAHEMAHAIDPCLMPSEPHESKDYVERENNFSFPNVLGCLRGEKSANAGYNQYIFDGKTEVAGQVNRKPKDIFCHTDHLTESFSDWVAADVLADYVNIQPRLKKLSPQQKLNGIANVFAGSPVCNKKSAIQDKREHRYGEVSGPHPSANVRANRILMVNQKIRGVMGCDQPVPETMIECTTETAPENAGKRYAPEKRTGPNIGGAGGTDPGPIRPGTIGGLGGGE